MRITPALRLIPFLVLLLAPVAGPDPAAAHVVTDDAGRSFEIPDRIGRVFAAGPPATIILYTLAPDKLLGWTRANSPEAAEYLDPKAAALPELGRLTGRGDTANIETLLRARPDLILDYGTVNQTYASLADRVQAQTGVPTLLIDGGFDRIPLAYRTLGALLGATERAETLAAYAERVLAEARGLADAVPADRRPRVYYARGTDGLDTAVKGSINAELIDRVGAVNVADAAGSGNLAKVSPEQVLAWNPDVILTLDRNFQAAVGRDPRWQGVRAVADGRVYRAPDLPVGWFDPPPSVNRLIGLPWLARVLYPDRSGDDIREQTRTFYRLFYRHELTDDQLDRLLAGAVPRRP